MPRPSPSTTVRTRVVLMAAVAALAPWLGSAAAHAQAPDYARSGFYVSASGLYITDLYEDEIENLTLGSLGVTAAIDPSFGFGVRVGGRFLRIVALELDYEWVDEYDIDLGLPGFGNVARVELQQQTFTANLRLFAPLGRFQPYVLAGIGFQRLGAKTRSTVPALNLSSVDDETVLAGRVGLGFDLYLTEQVALYSEGLVVLTNEEVDIVTPLGTQTVENIFYAGIRWGAKLRF